MMQGTPHDRSYDAPAQQVSTGVAAHMTPWGAAVHGSSAFLQATGASPYLNSTGHSKAPQQAHAMQYPYSTEVVQPGLSSSSGPPTSGNTDANACSNVHKQYPWSQTYFNTAAPSSAHQHEIPSTSAWPHHQQMQPHAQNYYSHSAHHQHHYFPQQQPRQQQYAWQGYHAYSASGPNLAGGAHGWQNWRSYSGYLHANSHGAPTLPVHNSASEPQPPMPTSYSSTFPERPQQQPPWRLTSQTTLPPQQQLPPQEQTCREVNNAQTSSCAPAFLPNSHKRAASFEAALPASARSGHDPEGASADEPYDPLADAMAAPDQPTVSSSACATVSFLGASASPERSGPYPAPRENPHPHAHPHLHQPHSGGRPVLSSRAPSVSQMPHGGHEKHPSHGMAAAAPPPSSMQPQPQSQSHLSSSSVHPPTEAPATDLIIVWDLDETLIIFNALLSGAFVRAAAAASPSGHGDRSPAAAAEAAAKVAPGVVGTAAEGSGGEDGSRQGKGEPSPLAASAMVLGQQLADLVFSFCDTHMGFQELDSIDPLCFAELCAAAKAPEGSADALFRSKRGGKGVVVHDAVVQRIAEMYGGGAEQLTALLGEPDCRTLGAVMAEAEALTGGWVAAARRLLADLSAAAPPTFAVRRVRHMLVSAGHLVASLGKLLLWGLDEHFDIWDVYSASGTPKLHVFRALAGRLGPAHIYTAVGDGAEEERAAAAMGWGFVRVGLAANSAPRASAPEHWNQGGTGSAREEMPVWRVARPVGAIRAEDVFGAAKEAYQ